MSAALSLAMDALEDAHARYLQACREHIHDLLVLGQTPENVEPALASLDLVEDGQNGLVDLIREMAE